MSKKNIVKNFNSWEEVIDTPETEIVEENCYIEENFIKNKDLIRMDMNIIQYPIFSKNTRRKVNQIVKYYFNKNRDTYITIKPSAGNYIPGETEEKIFITLLQIMKEKKLPKKFIVSSTELKNKANILNNNYTSTVKTALLRLSETNYNFKNTLYSSDKKGVLKEEVSTPILSLKILTLSLKENSKYREYYDDKRMKEIYEITISDHFYNNIIQKGYMVYNSDILLDINTSTARTLYMFIEKLRYENTKLKIDTVFLIKRIPLKYDKQNIINTLKTLRKAFEELENKRLIKSFEFIKETTWEKSEISIEFYEETLIQKQQRFFEDRNDFRKIISTNTISETEHEILKENIDNVVTLELVEKTYQRLPKIAKNLKSMKKTIEDCLNKYGEEIVLKSIEYIKNTKNLKSPRAYFLKTIENKWYEDIKLKEKPVELKQEQLISTTSSYNKENLEIFNNLSLEEQEEIENIVYEEYIRKCGAKTKIQEISFKGTKNKLICEYIEKNPIKNKKIKDIEIEEINSDELVLDEVKAYVDDKFSTFLALMPMENEIVSDLKENVLFSVVLKMKNNKISSKTLEEIINNEFRNNRKKGV